MTFQIQNLIIQYPNSGLLLDTISFELNPNESVALLGANGTGKTSLLLAIMGLIPSQGTIRLDDLVLSKKTATVFRQKIGFVFQSPDDQLFCPTLRQDIAFGLENMKLPKETIQKRVEFWLNQFALNDFADRSAQTLSGGEKRMAALATVLAMEPEILLLDEPTSFLDARSKKRLEIALNNIHTPKLIATHDLAFAGKICQRALILDQHKIAADGQLDEILNNQDLLIETGLM